MAITRGAAAKRFDGIGSSTSRTEEGTKVRSGSGEHEGGGGSEEEEKEVGEGSEEEEEEEDLSLHRKSFIDWGYNEEIDGVDEDPLTKAVMMDDQLALFESLPIDEATGKRDVNYRVMWSRNILQYACYFGRLNCVKALISRGAHLLVGKGTDAGTPLHCACSGARSLSVVKYLINHARRNADGTLAEMLQAKTSAGLTPLSVAICSDPDGPIVALLFATLDEVAANLSKKSRKT